MTNPTLTPIRHGNWHVIDGQLVDLDEVQPQLNNPPAVPEPVHQVVQVEQQDDPLEE